MKRIRMYMAGGLAALLLLSAVPQHIGAETEGPIRIMPAVTEEDEIETEAEVSEEEVEIDGEDTAEGELLWDEEELEEEQQPDRLLMVSDTPLTVENVLYFEFDYYSTEVDCWSKDPDIVRVSLQHEGYDEELGGILGVTLYGIADGTTEIVITGGDEEVRRSVTVTKPTEDTGKQRLIDHMLLYGQTNELGDKILTREIDEWQAVALVEYNCWDDLFNFSYEEENPEEETRWYIMPTPEENSEYYITVHLGEEFLTATVDLATYEGEELAFEKGWFRVPADEELQPRANELSERAFAYVRDLLYEETGMLPENLFDVYEAVPVPEMG